MWLSGAPDGEWTKTENVVCEEDEDGTWECTTKSGTWVVRKLWMLYAAFVAVLLSFAFVAGLFYASGSGYQETISVAWRHVMVAALGLVVSLVGMLLVVGVVAILFRYDELYAAILDAADLEQTIWTDICVFAPIWVGVAVGVLLTLRLAYKYFLRRTMSHHTDLY